MANVGLNDPYGERGLFSKLKEQECYDLLGTGTVGHVAFIGSTGLQLLPVNFQLLDGVVYVQTARESILAELAKGLDDVAFSIDYREDLLQQGWSVVISGTSAVVNNESLIDRIRATRRLRPWAPGDRSVVIALTPRSISGRKVSQH